MEGEKIISLEDYLVKIKIGKATTYEEAIELLKTTELDAATYDVVFSFTPANFIKIKEEDVLEIPIELLAVNADILDNVQFISTIRADVKYHLHSHTYLPEEFDIFMTHDVHMYDSNVVIKLLEPLCSGDTFMFTMRKYVLREEVKDMLKNYTCVTNALAFPAVVKNPFSGDNFREYCHPRYSF